MQNLDQRSIDNFVKLKRQLNSEIKKLVPGTKEWIDKTRDYQQVTKRLQAVEIPYKEIAVQQKGLVAWGNKVFLCHLQAFGTLLFLSSGNLPKPTRPFRASSRPM